jgi:integral membrane protein (TIGR00529 family)
MDFLFDIPYVVRVLSTLVFILIVNKLIKQLILSLLIGAIALALWCGHPLATIVSISWERFSGLDNLLLMLVVSQVIWLSTQMAKTGTMTELVNAVRTLVSQRAAMAVLPAVIGLLPMPGGAIFSAPLVDDCDREKNIEPILKTTINFWFRHIWEYWWPLYPGVLMAIAITGLPMPTFMLMQLPLSLLSVFAGYIFLLRKIKNSNGAARGGERKRAILKKIFALLMPIIVIITAYTLIRLFLPVLANTNKYLPMITGIFLAQVFLQVRRPLSLPDWRKILFSKKALIMALLAGVIRVYGAFIEAQLSDGALLMAHVRNELSLWNIPLLLVMIAIPFISGIATGIAIGFVGASFPIVMSLMGTNPTYGTLLSTTLLAYASGYVGMLLSPVHVCLIVTNEHFKTSLGGSILKLCRPAAIIVAGSVGFYFLIRYVIF